MFALLRANLIVAGLCSTYATAEADRYDERPTFDLPRIQRAPAAAAPNKTSETAINPNVFRHVEGVDDVARAFEVEEARRELGDPFGSRLYAQPSRVPGTIGEVLAMLNADVRGQDRLSDQTVYIVSESGQISLDAAPAIARRARAVIVRRNSLANNVVFVAPSMRSDGALEVIAWDAGKKLLNFYERIFSPDNEPVWIWKGDSTGGWRSETRDHACFRCHRNGEPVMKELRQPWPNWHSMNATVKLESIPPESPLRTDPLFAIEPPSPFLRSADQLELVINQWITNVNQSRVTAYRNGEISARALLEPLFRTTTINLKSSIEPSVSTGGRIRVPWSFFLNLSGLADSVGLACDHARAFGEAEPSINREIYNSVLASLDFRLEQGDIVISRPGDTYFAFASPEVAKTDNELVSWLVSGGLVSRRFAATMLLVDVQNPVYSALRGALFALVPAWRANDIDGDGLEARLVSAFRAAKDSDDKDAALKTSLGEFFSLWELPAANWEKDYCRKVEDYLRNVGTKWRSGVVDPYFRLLGARREAFFASDHQKLKESDLLFPKSMTDPSLRMHFDGSVAP